MVERRVMVVMGSTAVRGEGMVEGVKVAGRQTNVVRWHMRKYAYAEIVVVQREAWKHGGNGGGGEGRTVDERVAVRLAVRRAVRAAVAMVAGRVMGVMGRKVVRGGG